MIHLIANIAWQSNGWTGQQELEAKGFAWVHKRGRRDHVALNFDLDHPRNRKCMYGYAPFMKNPVQYMKESQDRGAIFFCSTHPKDGRWIVGIYGKASVYEKMIRPPKHDLDANITAPRECVIPFQASCYVPFVPHRHLEKEAQGWRRYFTYINNPRAKMIAQEALAYHLWAAKSTRHCSDDVHLAITRLQKFLKSLEFDPSRVVPHPPRQSLVPKIPDTGEVEFDEGGRIIVQQDRLMRDQDLVRIKKALSDGCCEVCGFSFEKYYGDHGKGFIECHHKSLLARQGKTKTRLSDLSVVCANCHRMLHRGSRLLSIGKLKSILRKEPR